MSECVCVCVGVHVGNIGVHVCACYQHKLQ